VHRLERESGELVSTAGGGARDIPVRRLELGSVQEELSASGASRVKRQGPRAKGGRGRCGRCGRCGLSRPWCRVVARGSVLLGSWAARASRSVTQSLGHSVSHSVAASTATLLTPPLTDVAVAGHGAGPLADRPGADFRLRDAWAAGQGRTSDPGCGAERVVAAGCRSSRAKRNGRNAGSLLFWSWSIWRPDGKVTRPVPTWHSLLVVLAQPPINHHVRFSRCTTALM